MERFLKFVLFLLLAPYVCVILLAALVGFLQGIHPWDNSTFLLVMGAASFLAYRYLERQRRRKPRTERRLGALERERIDLIPHERRAALPGGDE